MTNVPQATWEFDTADPDVGIFGDAVYHMCEDEPQPATITNVRHYPAITPGIVNEQTTLECPDCGATTSTVDQYPAAWFAEPGHEPAPFEVVAEVVVTVVSEPECDGCDQDPWTAPEHYGTCPLAE
jgi:hypothetical protein